MPPVIPALPEKPAPITAETEVTSEEEAAPPSAAAVSAVPEQAVSPAVPPASTPPTPVGRVSAIGDSVMLGAVYALQQEMPNLGIVDAQVGLQVAAAIDILRNHRATGELGDTVVIHLGNNGTFTPEQFDEMMGVLTGVRRVVVVNLRSRAPGNSPTTPCWARGWGDTRTPCSSTGGRRVLTIPNTSGTGCTSRPRALAPTPI